MHSTKDRFRDKRERSFGAHQQVLKKLDWAIKIQEGIKPVAHRIFQLEMAADDIY